MTDRRIVSIPGSRIIYPRAMVNWTGSRDSSTGQVQLPLENIAGL